jgi:PIN domain nuclease of toxin-antitoxin system
MPSIPGACRRIITIPFDRLIIAQAYLEGLVLGTPDQLMRHTGVAMLGLH